MINVDKLFPNLSDIYTEEGVNETHVMAVIIEEICKVLNPNEVKHFLKFVDSGRWNETFIMFREEMSI